MNENLAYIELSSLAKKYLKKYNEQTLLSPLEACRLAYESETNPNKLHAILEVERYLINFG
jgi:hypothetical protein